MKIINDSQSYEINSDHYINDVLKPFLTKLSNTDKRIGYFQQDGATAHTSNASLTIVGSRIISKNLWLPRSPDLTPPDFYLWGAMKNKIYCSNPRIINELKETITDYIQKVDDTVLKDVFRNMMTCATRCTNAGGGHFQQLL